MFVLYTFLKIYITLIIFCTVCLSMSYVYIFLKSPKDLREFTKFSLLIILSTILWPISGPTALYKYLNK